MIRLATMSSVCPDWDLDQTIAGMKRHGYVGLEPRVEWNHASGIEAHLSAAERQTIRDRVKDEGLEFCCIATGVQMATPDVVKRDQHIADLRTYVDLAADLGCPLVRTFGGPRDRDRELGAVVDYVAEGYRQVLSQASDRGVTVLMETHDDWSCSASVRAVVERTDHPNLKVLWDVMHTQRMQERPDESYRILRSHVRHLHVHDGTIVDGQIRIDPLGEGIIDHATPLPCVQETGCDLFASVEVIHEPGSSHDPDGVLKQYAEGLRSMLGC